MTTARKRTDVRYLNAEAKKLGAAARAAAADLARVGVVLDLEGVAAAAGGDGVRVVDLEPGLLDRLEVVDARAAQVRGAERVDDDRHALAVEGEIALLGSVVEAEAVLEAGAAAALDRDPEDGDVRLLRHQRADLLGRRRGQR